jgi:hypothetical protein
MPVVTVDEAIPQPFAARIHDFGSCGHGLRKTAISM